MNITQENGGPPIVRRLVIETPGGDMGMVHIEPHHSLHDVRHLIQEEFDAEMIPQPDFYFFVVDESVRIARKQEARCKAMHFLGQNVKLLPVTSEAPSQSAAVKRTADAQDSNHTPAKKTCPAMVVPTTITQTEECSPQGAVARGPPIDRFSFLSCPMPAEAPDEVQEARKPAARPLIPTCDPEEDNGDNGEHGDDYGFMDDNSDKSNNEVSTAVHEDVIDTGTHRDSSGAAEFPSANKTNESKAHAADVQEVTIDSHEKYNQAVQQSRSVLAQIGDLLEENPEFCSPSRREEWNEEISALLGEKETNIIIGMLGATGEFVFVPQQK
jgi:hypothetical protein